MPTSSLLYYRRRAPRVIKAIPTVIRQLCRRRASKRWSALLTQTRSRIGHHFGMRQRLGDTHWDAFVRYAETYHKHAFLRALIPPNAVLCCVGKLDGTPCSKHLDLSRDLATVKCNLESYHMDHTHDAAHICQTWSHALPENPKSWDDGLCGPLIAQLLFGVEDHPMSDVDTNPLWKKQIVLRCGNKKNVHGQRAADFCHDVAHAHYTHALTTADLRLGLENDETEEEEMNDDDETVDDEETVGDDPDETVCENCSVDLTLEDGANEDNAIDLDL